MKAVTSKSIHRAVRIPNAEAAKIDELAAASGIPVSQIILACIRRALPYVENKVRSLPESASPRPSITGEGQ